MGAKRYGGRICVSLQRKLLLTWKTAAHNGVAIHLRHVAAASLQC